MSRFAEKIMSGEKPTVEDWNDHLMEAHRLAPSMTPQAYAAYESRDGKNSYARLAEAVAGVAADRDSTILDLACGDGHLISYILESAGPRGKVVGVDMSEGELAVARKNHSGPRVSFVRSTTQKLPLADGSVDHALCHMAIMLMNPLEPVVAELARVLKPGGIFAAVTNHPQGRKGLYAELAGFSVEIMNRRFPILKNLSFGDSRIYTPEGLDGIFTPQSGFESKIERSEFTLGITCGPEGPWNLLKDSYHIGMLPEEKKSEVKSEFLKFCEAKLNAAGSMSFEYPMQKFVVQKRRDV